jgi:hypothetical protein
MSGIYSEFSSVEDTNQDPVAIGGSRQRLFRSGGNVWVPRGRFSLPVKTSREGGGLIAELVKALP